MNRNSFVMNPETVPNSGSDVSILSPGTCNFEELGSSRYQDDNGV